MPVPKGEITAVVMCIFVNTRAGVELAAYGYKDNLGVQHVFRLDMKTKCYKRHHIPKQQNSCVTYYLKAAFNVDPTDR